MLAMSKQTPSAPAWDAWPASCADGTATATGMPPLLPCCVFAALIASSWSDPLTSWKYARFFSLTVYSVFWSIATPVTRAAEQQTCNQSDSARDKELLFSELQGIRLLEQSNVSMRSQTCSNMRFAPSAAAVFASSGLLTSLAITPSLSFSMRLATRVGKPAKYYSVNIGRAHES